MGDNFFCNFNCIFLDLNKIHIGNNVAIGPRVSIYTALHPIDREGRNTGQEYALPVIIEDDVWIAGDVVINPGVTIGGGSVIGSGSVVTKNIPKNVVALGNPCSVHREITEKDKSDWEAMYEAYQASIE
ncbi:DapH/DapD/GlmU-related protein [Oceanobacillus sp. FSL W7-1281]|uniref:DapH/DapD/GlmU-related protein n=1 Tax=Oceanobacillus sp. FSL W7-1281 TaxID=2921698 RepID=UPI0030D9483A